MTFILMILIKRIGYLAIIICLFVACGNGDENVPSSYLISEMEYIDFSARDTTYFYFTYKDEQLFTASVDGQSKKSYTAVFDDNGKVYDVGDKRFEWEGDRLMKIIFDNGIWIDLEYTGAEVNKGYYRYYDQGGQIVTSGRIGITYNGANLAVIDNYDEMDRLTSQHTFAGFDSMKNTFTGIWWFLYIDNTLSMFNTQILPGALYMINNPASYKFEAPLVQFERIIGMQYEYDGNGRVTKAYFNSQNKEYELNITY